MRRTAVWTIAPALLVAAVVTASPSSAHLPTAKTVGSVTTITATQSGTAELVLDDDATLSPRAERNPDVHIAGSGRLVAFELTRRDGGGDILSGARLPRFAGGGTVVGGSTTPPGSCTAWPSNDAALQENCTDPSPKAITLHEGYYHLVVVTDGAPVRITLTLHGLQTARSMVRLQSSLRSLEATLPERESIGSSTLTYGTDVNFAGASQTFSIVAARLHAAAPVLASSICSRSDSGAPPPYAFSAACPNGDDSGVSWRISGVPEAQGGVVFVGSPTGSSSPDGLGGSFTDNDGPRYLGGLGVWIAGDTLTSFGGYSSDIAAH